MEPFQVRRGGDHGLGDDDLAHDGGELVQLAQSHADEALLLVLLVIGAGRSGGSGFSGSGGLGSRCGRLRSGRLLRLLLRRGGDIVVGLVGVHGTRLPDHGNGFLPVLGVFKHQQKAVVDDLLGGGGVALHGGGVVEEVRLGAEALNRGDEHVGPQVLHAAAVVKEHPQLIGEVGIAGAGGGVVGAAGIGGGSGRRRGGGGRCGLGSGGGLFRRLLALNFSDQAINICKEAVDIFVKGLFCLHLLHFLAEIVHRVEHHVEQRGTVRLLHHGHRAFPDEEEHVFNPVGDGRQGVELHHGGGALDGMHDPENLVYIVLGEGIFLFCVQNDRLQLLQQRVGFVDIHIQDVIAAHGNTTSFVFFRFIGPTPQKNK